MLKTKIYLFLFLYLCFSDLAFSQINMYNKQFRDAITEKNEKDVQTSNTFVI
jgi:hypothetical protein